MGSSNWQPIPFAIDVLTRVQPARVLDVGVGFGRWGMLVREFCELWQERIFPDTWKVRVEGIEAFPKSIQAWHASFYDRVHIGDARTLLRELPGPWDLVILGDVLEHIEKPLAKELVGVLLDKAGYLLINIPIGKEYPQGQRYGNPYERHISEWDMQDFSVPQKRCSRLFHDYCNRPYYSVVLSRSDAAGLARSLGVVECLDASARDAARAAILKQVQAVLDRAAGARPAAKAQEARAQAAEAQAARAQAAETQALRRVAELQAAATAIDSSTAWRMLQFMHRSGVLWLPRKLARIFRGRPPAQPAPQTQAPTGDGVSGKES